MGLPSKLKNMNLFLDGTGFLGQATEVTLPKLSLQLEDFRGGGMLGPVPVDLGVEKLEAEFTIGGLIASALAQFGATTHDAAQVRFAGAFQSDGTGRVQAVDAVMRGRYSEIDFGNAKPGEDTEHKYKLSASYYKLTVDGTEWLEIDMLAGVFRVFGVDRYAEIRAAIAG